jgi:hypothetical protein
MGGATRRRRASDLCGRHLPSLAGRAARGRGHAHVRLCGRHLGARHRLWHHARAAHDGRRRARADAPLRTVPPCHQPLGQCARPQCWHRTPSPLAQSSAARSVQRDSAHSAHRDCTQFAARLHTARLRTMPLRTDTPQRPRRRECSAAHGSVPRPVPCRSSWASTTRACGSRRRRCASGPRYRTSASPASPTCERRSRLDCGALGLRGCYPVCKKGPVLLESTRPRPYTYLVRLYPFLPVDRAGAPRGRAIRFMDHAIRHSDIGLSRFSVTLVRSDRTCLALGGLTELRVDRSRECRPVA